MNKSGPDIFDESRRRVSPTSAYAQRFTELIDASRTVGFTHPRQLLWVTQFIGEDPNLWNGATERSHANCLAVLATHPIPETMRGGIRLPAPIASDDVRHIHQSLKDTLKKAVAADVFEPIPISMDGVSVSLVRATGKG